MNLLCVFMRGADFCCHAFFLREILERRIQKKKNVLTGEKRKGEFYEKKV